MYIDDLYKEIIQLIIYVSQQGILQLIPWFINDISAVMLQESINIWPTPIF